MRHYLQTRLGAVLLAPAPLSGGMPMCSAATALVSGTRTPK